MFKRANKITALLVAAAAVVSVLPATAANAADVKRIESEDGIVYNAVAYKEGKFLYDGEVKDEDGAYYLADGKYTDLEDVDSGADYEVYGSKYVKVDDGDYFVDLTNGKVTDDSIDEDDEDDAASALRKKIKESDRYDDKANTHGAGDADIADLSVIPGAKFGDTWYSAKYAADASNKGAAAADFYNIYTDAKGAYIDADYNLGKIKVSDTTASGAKTVTVENTKDKYEVAAKDDTFIQIVDSVVLGQDSNNIYRYAILNVTGGTVVNGKEVGAKATALPVIQKISKAQDSDDIDDGKYAKTVTNYVVSTDGAKFADKDGDVKDFQ